VSTRRSTSRANAASDCGEITPYVQRHPADFVRDGELVPDVRAKVEAESPPPEPLGRVRLRVRELPDESEHKHDPLVVQRSKAFYVGDTLEAEGKDAEAILDTGAVEIVKHLDKEK
jgi:hypothetical protein